MKFTLEIDSNTAAFDPERPEQEIANILHGVETTLRFIGFHEDRRAIKTPIADVNGIKCGSWELRRDA